ncbi:hypothetical protein ACE1ET_08890 [Saccharicrinis sp. FJH62]|uniref:hypothetical protein n=1 Tax=Saccharicrinis sp. FJH62 TaxID=3344657 RepID=UPI0035D41EC3
MKYLNGEKRLLLLISVVFISINSPAQYWKTRDQSQLKNSVNIGLNGFYTSSLYINYGRMIWPNHEIVIGIPLISVPDYPEKGFFLNYRYHFKPKINSLFAGLFYNYSQIDGIVNYSTYNGDILTSSHDYPHVTSNRSFGVNVGKKWVTKPGICFTARIGYGFNRFKSEWSEGYPDVEFMNDTDNTMNVLGHIDFELSVGYAFNFVRK